MHIQHCCHMSVCDSALAAFVVPRPWLTILEPVVVRVTVAACRWLPTFNSWETLIL